MITRGDINMDFIRISCALVRAFQDITSSTVEAHRISSCWPLSNSGVVSLGEGHSEKVKDD